MMLKAGSVGNIMKELRCKKTFLTTYRSDNDGSPRYCEMKFVKVGGENDEPQAVALGFSVVDEAVFHVDHDAMTIEAVRITDAYRKRNPSLETKMDYLKYVEAVASNIAPEDKQAFVDALSSENINAEFIKRRTAPSRSKNAKRPSATTIRKNTS